uniref:Scm like with four mbt domains 2 n=1 Tax=Fundulus heteroclitus TaxID=8078 RepID=A0A3Q2QGQ4_FUNHE
MQTGAQEQALALTAAQPTNGREEEVNSDAAMEEEFIWEEYMEETGADAAPHTTFRHVETSLESSFQPGMKLEVANKSNPETYWVATIITTCGQLLLLRYSGYGDDRKADFWCDVMTAELHPVGWCSQNNKTLMPPEDNVYLRTDGEKLFVEQIGERESLKEKEILTKFKGKCEAEMTHRSKLVSSSATLINHQKFLYLPADVFSLPGRASALWASFASA